ncbi:hypothetical protein T06_10054 [Trichinella sp. T6]|nr:hypothetical protein T06_10054 [Trichinella sp. T6]
MKLVPFATRVRMDVKAFPSRPSVPLLITNPQRRNSIFFINNTMTNMQYNTLNRTVAANDTQIAFPTVLMFFLDTQGKEELHYFLEENRREPHLE